MDGWIYIHDARTNWYHIISTVKTL
uniref:Uncharacterized protein n=1 Tax=Arundo donax TaxID=35708 RepID=A0A0A9A3L9_ARUDO